MGIQLKGVKVYLLKSQFLKVKRKIALLELESNCGVKPSWQSHLIPSIKNPPATTEIQVFFIIARESLITQRWMNSKSLQV